MYGTEENLRCEVHGTGTGSYRLEGFRIGPDATYYFETPDTRIDVGDAHTIDAVWQIHESGDEPQLTPVIQVDDDGRTREDLETASQDSPGQVVAPEEVEPELADEARSQGPQSWGLVWLALGAIGAVVLVIFVRVRMKRRR